MTAAPTMKTAVSDTPPEEMPSIGTGEASTNVAASASATPPPSTARLGVEAPDVAAAAARAVTAASATGARSGRSRAVSRDARVPGLSTWPDALSDERIGRSFTLSCLPVPAFGLAEEGGEYGGRNEQIRELCLPMQHLFSPVSMPGRPEVSVCAPAF